MWKESGGIGRPSILRAQVTHILRECSLRESMRFAENPSRIGQGPLIAERKTYLSGSILFGWFDPSVWREPAREFELLASRVMAGVNADVSL